MINIFDPDHGGDFFTVTYYFESHSTLAKAAWDTAIGQSVGNPDIRNDWETAEMLQSHCCFILHEEKQLKRERAGIVKIAFPVANIDFAEDGISQLLCQIMGGQLDISGVAKCHVLDIDLPPSMTSLCRRPKFGLSGAREFTSAYGKPLLGGIIKPKTGINVDTLLDIVKALVDGGVNFIKEDEIMSNPACCRLSARLPRVMEYLDGKRVIYAACINSDFPHVMDRAKWVHSVGGNAVHVNFWSGMGTYRAIRELDLPLFLFFQKSGDKILTHGNHDFHISWNVICKLAGLMGCDFIHAGMWGGYLSDDEQQLKATLKLLQHYNVVPSLSCGMHPGLIEAINKRFGVDYMANVGGAIHGHPGGTLAGAKAMRQAIDGRFDTEYYDSLKKWPKVPA